MYYDKYGNEISREEWEKNYQKECEKQEKLDRQAKYLIPALIFFFILLFISINLQFDISADGWLGIIAILILFLASKFW